jgi:hypothetical protein
MYKLAGIPSALNGFTIILLECLRLVAAYIGSSSFLFLSDQIKICSPALSKIPTPDIIFKLK